METKFILQCEDRFVVGTDGYGTYLEAVDYDKVEYADYWCISLTVEETKKLISVLQETVDERKNSQNN